MESLGRWVEQQYRHSAGALMQSVSPVQIVKTRPGFGQTVVPRKGSIVASPVLGAYDPEPDYFFHWYRDSAVVVDALRVLDEDPSIASDAARHIADFLHFSLSLQTQDGRVLAGDSLWRSATAPDYRRFLRTNEDLSQAHGEAVAGETRVNPDGTLDISGWPRPQNDGPALRALSVLGWLQNDRLDNEARGAADALLQADLGYTLSNWRKPCFDIWEEEQGLHYYTLRVAAAALEGGADWYGQLGQTGRAIACRSDAKSILSLLDGYWLTDEKFYRSRVLDSGARSSKELDIAVILAAIHARGSGETHSVYDPRMHATLERLEALFDAAYPINRNRGNRAPAMGRYAGDVYYSGGAYYFSTLAAAEFCFRAAVRAPAAKRLVEHGDAFLETVRAFTPPGGEMSEQFDQQSGAPRSAQQLAWSYAAFITCAHARRQIG
jgi:glucoamylase